MLTNDPLSQVCYVDLSPSELAVKDRPDLFEAGLGGSGAPFACWKRSARKELTRWDRTIPSFLPWDPWSDFPPGFQDGVYVQITAHGQPG